MFCFIFPKRISDTCILRTFPVHFSTFQRIIIGGLLRRFFFRQVSRFSRWRNLRDVAFFFLREWILHVVTFARGGVCPDEIGQRRRCHIFENGMQTGEVSSSPRKISAKHFGPLYLTSGPEPDRQTPDEQHFCEFYTGFTFVFPFAVLVPAFTSVTGLTRAGQCPFCTRPSLSLLLCLLNRTADYWFIAFSGRPRHDTEYAEKGKRLVWPVGQFFTVSGERRKSSRNYGR